jgi:hypothetical protein
MLVAGWATVLILLAFNFGNHEGHTANIWLTGVAIVMAFGLVLHSARKRNAWRR